jgi:hypothetical protein
MVDTGTRRKKVSLAGLFLFFFLKFFHINSTFDYPENERTVAQPPIRSKPSKEHLHLWYFLYIA